MIHGKPVAVEVKQRDRSSRSGRVWIGAKHIPLHTMCILITRNQYDRQAYLESRTGYSSDTAHAGMMAVRTIDLGAALGPLRESLGQTMLGSATSLSRQDLIGAAPLAVDPSMEYTWYGRHQEKLADDPSTSIEIRRLAHAMHERLPSGQRRLSSQGVDLSRQELHDNFWLRLLRDDSTAASIVSKALAVQHRWGADIALPPVPAARNVAMLEVTAKINRLASAVWTGDSCADYIMLTPEFFGSERNIGALTERMLSLDAKINVLKFKNHALEQVPKIDERVMFKRILEAVNKAKSADPNRTFMLMEAGHAMYPAVAGGFDIVSTGTTGIDYESPGYARPAGGGNRAFGHYYSPKHMTTLKWPSVKRLLLSGNGLPCGCEVCRRMKPDPSGDEWNLQRRSHYIHCTSRMLADLTRLVDDQRMELARQKIAKSAISNFAEALPYVS